MYNIIYKAHVRLDNNGIVEQFLGRCAAFRVSGSGVYCAQGRCFLQAPRFATGPFGWSHLKASGATCKTHTSASIARN